jgi:signal transduction histidine kinase
LAHDLSSRSLQLEWQRDGARAARGIHLPGLADQLLRHEPDLASWRLQMLVSPDRAAGVGGTLALRDGSALVFRNHTVAVWPLMAGHMANLLLPTAAFAVLAWLLTYASLRPLRRLVRASRRVGTRHARPMAEEGPGEVQLLIRAFNTMQQRIDALLDANVQTMLAIGHDLRTPLARLQLRMDALEMEAEERDALEDDIAEMRDLLASLQTYVEADNTETPAQRVDLAAMAQTLVDGAVERGLKAVYHGPDQLVVTARPLALRRALSTSSTTPSTMAASRGWGWCAMWRGWRFRWRTRAGHSARGSGARAATFRAARSCAFARRGRQGAGMGLGLAIVARAWRPKAAPLPCQTCRAGAEGADPPAGLVISGKGNISLQTGKPEANPAA